jgi:hypothetical protein
LCGAGNQRAICIDELKVLVNGEALPDRVEIFHETSRLAPAGHGLGNYGGGGEHTLVGQAFLEPHVGFPRGLRTRGHQLLRNLLRECPAALPVSDERDDERRDERRKNCKGKDLPANTIQPKLQ